MCCWFLFLLCFIFKQIYCIWGLLFCCMLDDGRDPIQRIDMPTNLPFPERRAAAADGLLQGDSAAQFSSSSLPAPPRPSNFLPPPPRVGPQNPGFEAQGRDGIGIPPIHDRPSVAPRPRLMIDEPAVLPGLVVSGGWLPPRQSQRGGIGDHRSDWSNSRRDDRPAYRGHGRGVDKWRYE